MITPGGEPDDAATAVDPWLAAEQARQTMAGLIFAAFTQLRAERTPTTSLPLTIIGGFLGAGKTTLLSHLLGEPHGRRLAVLINDFGNVNIDAGLIASRSDDVIALTNGCVCCATSGNLTRALTDIAQRSDPPDAIVLEASGLAEPGGIAQIAMANPAIRVDGILTLVDAASLSERTADPRTSRPYLDQLAAADLIVLTKADLFGDPGLAPAREWLGARYPGTPVIEAVHGEVPADVVLGVEAPHPLSPGPRFASDHTHDFSSVSFSFHAPLDRQRFQATVDALPASLLRAKGVLHFDDQPDHRTIYQRVGTRSQYSTGSVWGPDEACSTLVLVGPFGSIDEPTLDAELAACCVATQQ